MLGRMIDLTLYAVTDSRWLNGKPLAQAVEEAILGGATIVQLREKMLSYEEKKKLAREVLKVCRSYGIPLIINDDVHLAKEIDADGVHLGQSDMEIGRAREILGDKIIGITAKTVEQAKCAAAAGADYLGSGAVFGSSTKDDAKPLDHDLLDTICESVDIPVTAIGGINKDNIMELKGRKMSGFAVVSGIFHSEDIKSATAELKKLCTSCTSSVKE